MDLEEVEAEFVRRRDEHRLRRHHTARGLLDFIEFLFTVIERLLAHHHKPKGRSLIMQVVINDQQKVRLHGAEDNAEGAVVPTDEATPAWSADRTDLVTLVPVDGDPWSYDVVGTDGAVGDTVVTLTATEPDGTELPPLTQVVTVGPDSTPVALQITADTPEPK